MGGIRQRDGAHDPRASPRSVGRLRRPVPQVRGPGSENEAAVSVLLRLLRSPGLARFYFSKRVHIRSWVKSLHEDCKRQGLVNVEVSRVATAVERLPCMTDLFMMGWEELIGMVKDEGRAAELRDFFPGAVAETRAGLGYDMDRVTVVGKKVENLKEY